MNGRPASLRVLARRYATTVALAALWRRYLRLHWARAFAPFDHVMTNPLDPNPIAPAAVFVVVRRHTSFARLRRQVHARDRDLFDLAARDDTAGDGCAPLVSWFAPIKADLPTKGGS